MGDVQELPSGNFLSSDGQSGRAFEVTREGKIVWEFYNPIATKTTRAPFYRMTRYAYEDLEPELLEKLKRKRKTEDR